MVSRESSGDQQHKDASSTHWSLLRGIFPWKKIVKLKPVKGLLGWNLLNVHGSVYHNSATMSCMPGMNLSKVR